jgi:hypothetical protein
MYCSKCGTKLPDEANFCWKCGKSQKEGIPNGELQWERCYITYEGVQQSGWISTGKARWWANVTGPEGSYRAGASSTFDAGVFNQEVEVPTGPHDYAYRRAITALDELVNKLVADGWEPISSMGEPYWNKQFRRRK